MKKITIFLALCVLATQSFDLRSSSPEGVGSRVQHALTRTGRAVSQVVQDRMQDPSNSWAVASAALFIGAQAVRVIPAARTIEDAIEFNDMRSLKLLLDGGADVNVEYGFKSTPLHNAVKKGNAAMVRLLVSRGAHVNAADSFGVTPVQCAANTGNSDMMNFLVQHGADLSAIDHRGRTTLHYAARTGNHAMVHFLISLGLDPNALDEDGNGPLSEAIYTMTHHRPNPAYYDVAAELCRAGANVNAVNRYGTTPFRAALYSTGQERLITLLHQSGADVNAPCSGKIPLQRVIESHNPMYVELLIALGANVNERDTDGKTLLDISSEVLDSYRSLADASITEKDKQVQRILRLSCARDEAL